MTDLLVAGAGPVGLAVAVGAARAGLDVVVADPRALPRDKACGEGLMPSSVAALRALGVDPPGLELRGIRYVDGRHRAEARFRHGPGRGVRRTSLVAALEDAAAAAGVRREHHRVSTVEPVPGGVRAAGRQVRYLVVADGLHSPLRRTLGLAAPVAVRAPRYGLRRHYRVPPWSDLVEVHWARDAEAYVTPVAEDLVGVAVLCRGGAPYDAWLEHFPALRRRLADAAPAGPVRGAGPLRQRTTRRVSGRALLVGDAAGYVDALTGEGLAVGLACARRLVDCLVSDRPEDYERAWRSASRRPRALTAGLLWATRRPAARAALVPAAARLPWAFRGVVRALA